MANIDGERSHDLVQMGLTALRNLEHRGASGADPDTGDGAGISLQVPDRLLREVAGCALPPPGAYATGIAFLPQEQAAADAAVELVEHIVADEGARVLGWRDVPIDPSGLGRAARDTMPRFRQVFIAKEGFDGNALERLAYAIRKRTEHEIRLASSPDEASGIGGSSEMHDGVYFPSLSTRTLVYKGMLTAAQLGGFFRDLADPSVESSIALVHSRFSTNTFPSWPLAHPYRLVAHNGEINTIAGNRNFMRSRETSVAIEPDSRRPQSTFPHLHAGRFGHCGVRRGPRTPSHGRLLAPRGGAHDDP